jgi:leucyl aminopeptidase (aminopeptidase T)
MGLLLMDALSIFDEPPPLARRTDPATSKAGARDVTMRAGSQCAQLLRAYAEADARGIGLTRYEAGQVTGLAARGACYWHRVGDLEREGLVADTGETRVMPTGSAQAVVRITDEGRRIAGGLS